MQLPSSTTLNRGEHDVVEETNHEWMEKLAFLKDALSDEHYTNQDIFLTCFSDPNYINPAATVKKNSNDGKATAGNGSPPML